MNDKLLKSFINAEHPELLDKALQKGKGVFLISGHISNWEIVAFSCPVIYQKYLNVVTKPQSNKFINCKINEYRSLLGNEMIEIGVSLRNIFNKILQNKIVCFLMDQSAHPDYSVYAAFFGQNVATFSGPAKMGLKFNTEILFAFGIRDENYKYNITIEKIDYSDLIGNESENVRILTERINKRLEDVIRKYPDQWLWFHRRFKHVKN